MFYVLILNEEKSIYQSNIRRISVRFFERRYRSHIDFRFSFDTHHHFEPTNTIPDTFQYAHIMSDTSLPTAVLTAGVPLGRISEEGRELAAERRDLETREEAVRDTGREVGLSLDEGRSVLGREKEKLRDEADQLDRVRQMS